MRSLTGRRNRPRPDSTSGLTYIDVTSATPSPPSCTCRPPEPATGKVLVEVEAASVNGFDPSVAAGYVWDMIPGIDFPVMLGRDLVGTVTAVGDGVEKACGRRPGRRRHPRHGPRSEERQLHRVRRAVRHRGHRRPVRCRCAAGRRHRPVGIAAHDALEALDIHTCETVLVSGGPSSAPPARDDEVEPMSTSRVRFV